jgi:ABC-type bacteriocin/lantibiotic exporter with double-glycine peptidase domain
MTSDRTIERRVREQINREAAARVALVEVFDPIKELDALRAENERLRKASNAVLDFYDGPLEAKRPDVFAMLMRDLARALERKPE